MNLNSFVFKKGIIMNKQFTIQDWAGNRMFPEMVFDTYEEGWEYIYANVDNTEYDITEDEDYNVYQDIYVV